MKKLFILLFSVGLLSSCGKDKAQNKPKSEIDQVFVRIQNEACFELENATIATTGYGTVETGTLTDYQALTIPIYSANCVFTINGSQFGAGSLICGTPLPPELEPGYYTFIIEPAAGGYNGITVTKL